jgi:hypothetical protein
MQDDEVKNTTGLFCFQNAERECGPDCMAYASVPVEGADYQRPDGTPHQWARCMLLVQQHKVAKHLVFIANLMKVQEHRATQPSPPTNAV